MDTQTNIQTDKEIKQRDRELEGERQTIREISRGRDR